MLAFKKISDFKGTSDKREFQPYAVMLVITLLIINSFSSDRMGPMELSLRLAGLILVLLPLPALMTRRLRDLGHLTMGKVWLGAAAVSLLSAVLMFCVDWGAMAIVAFISYCVVGGLGAAIFLLCFFRSAKVKSDKAKVVKK